MLNGMYGIDGWQGTAGDILSTYLTYLTYSLLPVILITQAVRLLVPHAPARPDQAHVTYHQPGRRTLSQN
jgi:hypothetical protein